MTTIKNIDLLVFDEVYKLHSDIEIDKKDKRIIPMNSCYFDFPLIDSTNILFIIEASSSSISQFPLQSSV